MTAPSCRSGRVVLFALVLALSSFGGVAAGGGGLPGPVEASAVQSEPAGQLNGTVIAPDGSPLSETRIVLTAESGGVLGMAETDAAGSISLSGLDPGTRTVTARAAGYGPSAPVTVDVGPTPTDVVFELTTAAEGRLEGTVTTPQGEPVDAETTVSFQSAAFDSSRTVTLGAEGSYELAEVPTGEYTVTATTAGHSSAALVSVAGDGPTTQEFSLVPSGDSVLTGRVTDVNETPLPAGTWVRFSADNAFGPPRTVALGEGGQYALTDLPAEGKSYNLQITAADYGSTTDIVSFPSQAETERDFALPPPNELAITSIDAPAAATVDSTLSVSVTVSNTGSVQTTESIAYRFDGRPVFTDSLTVSPGSARTMSVSVTPEQTGSVTHGVFTEHDAAYADIDIESDSSSGGSAGGGGGSAGGGGGSDSGGRSGGAVGGVTLPPIDDDSESETTADGDSQRGGDRDGTVDDSDETPADAPTGQNDTQADTDDQSGDDQPAGETGDDEPAETPAERPSDDDGDDGQPGFGILVTLCALLAGLCLARYRR
jgi:PGF-CTERM protein